VAPGDQLTVSTAAGRITLPVAVEAEMLEQVVHLPSKSPGSWVLTTLGATSGDVVRLARAGETPARDEEAGE
jgi:hypothetical protein